MYTAPATIEGPDKKLYEDLMEFSECRKSLALPYTVLRYFIDDYAIFYTDLGYHFYEIKPGDREHFFYEVFEDINSLTHYDELPDSTKEQIKSLEELDKNLRQFNLFSMAYDKESDEYLLHYKSSEVYITICAQDIPFISKATTGHLEGLGLNQPSNPYMIYLENDGRIVE